MDEICMERLMGGRNNGGGGGGLKDRGTEGRGWMEGRWMDREIERTGDGWSECSGCFDPNKLPPYCNELPATPHIMHATGTTPTSGIAVHPGIWYSRSTRSRAKQSKAEPCRIILTRYSQRQGLYFLPSCSTNSCHYRDTPGEQQ